MTSVSNIVSRIWRYRIAFVIALFVLGAGIFDEHSVLNILLLTNSNNELRHDIAEFEKQYHEDNLALQVLDNSPEAVEKVELFKI